MHGHDGQHQLLLLLLLHQCVQLLVLLLVVLLLLLVLLLEHQGLLLLLLVLLLHEQCMLLGLLLLLLLRLRLLLRLLRLLRLRLLLVQGLWAGHSRRSSEPRAQQHTAQVGHSPHLRGTPVPAWEEGLHMPKTCLACAGMCKHRDLLTQ